MNNPEIIMVWPNPSQSQWEAVREQFSLILDADVIMQLQRQILRQHHPSVHCHLTSAEPCV